MAILRTMLVAYSVSLAILLVILYFRERSKVGPIQQRTLLIMTEIAALFALLPATTYVLFTQLVKRGR